MPLTPLALELRRHLLRMVVAVVVLDLLAIVVYSLTPVHGWTGTKRIAFAALWLVLTLAIVLPTLQRMRRARLGARIASSGRSRGAAGR